MKNEPIRFNLVKMLAKWVCSDFLLIVFTVNNYNSYGAIKLIIYLSFIFLKTSL